MNIKEEQKYIHTLYKCINIYISILSVCIISIYLSIFYLPIYENNKEFQLVIIIVLKEDAKIMKQKIIF